MDQAQAKRIIEGLLYMTDHPLTVKEIIEILESKSLQEEKVLEILQSIGADLNEKDSPLMLSDVAGGYQMATRQDMAPWVRKLYKERLTVRLSPSALETLSIIAYKQPISRSDIEQIRGVEASGVVDTLLERRLIKVVGKKETIGRPLLYGTTIEFLRQFGLKHLSELPDLSTITPAEPATQETIPAAPESDEANKELALVGAEAEPPAADETTPPAAAPDEPNPKADDPA